MVGAIFWLGTEIVLGFYHIAWAVLHPGAWLNWSDKQSLMRFVYYGGSYRLFFAVFDTFAVVTAVGLWRPAFMWGVVRVLEGVANGVGRVAAWAGLVMVLQQIMVIFLQAVFRVSDITIAPFGLGITHPLGWWGDGLKLYNAMVVALCCTYTFVQGGHVRVDLIYSGVGFRAKRVIDMIGSLLFMVPMACLVWMYSWYFLWRYLITPKVSASDTLQMTLMKARAVRWTVETISFSPNGFNAYFLFKLLLVAFTGLVLVQAVAFFYRSLLEYREGPESAGRHLDLDSARDLAAGIAPAVSQ